MEQNLFVFEKIQGTFFSLDSIQKNHFSLINLESVNVQFIQNWQYEMLSPICKIVENYNIPT